MTRYFLPLGLFFSSFQVGGAQLPLDQQEMTETQTLTEPLDEVFSLENINSVISQTLDVKDGKYTYKDISDEQFDDFIDAMYSLEYRAVTKGEGAALILYGYLRCMFPFYSPKLLGDW